MNLRKTLLVGCAALLALALAAPAGASASVWKHGSVPLEEHVEIGLFGGEVFITEGGAMICNTHATLTIEAGSTGQISGYEVLNEECLGSGELAGCTVVAAEQPGGPWPVDVNATNLTITNAALIRTFNAGCAVESLESEVAEVSTTLYEPEAITEFEYSGAEGPTYSSFGSYFVEGEASGTYGIG